jgi:hypothetical protein
MLAPEPNKSPAFGPLFGKWTPPQIDKARQNVSYILINSKNFARPKNHDEFALKMTAKEVNIQFSLDEQGKKTVFELAILQEFGSKQVRREPNNVRLLFKKPDNKCPVQQFAFILKELSSRTYTCLESLDETVDGKMVLLYLAKLREEKVDYTDDLVGEEKHKILGARRGSLPLVFGAPTDKEEEAWNNFIACMRDD